MKHFHRILAVLLGGLFFFLILMLPLASQKRFEKLCDNIFREEVGGNSLTLHYTVANPYAYGIDAGKVTLGTEMPSASDKKRLLKNFLAIQTIARGSLSAEAQKTYDLLQYSLGVRLDGLRFENLREPLTPSIGIQSQLPVLLAEYAFRSEQDVINYLKLLSCVPGYFDSILAVENKKLKSGTFMDSETAGELISYCEQFTAGREHHFLTETFRERLEKLKLSARKNSIYIEENASLLEKTIFTAYERLARFLKANENAGNKPCGLAAYPEGRNYYRWLLRSEVGTDADFPEIENLLEQALAKDARTIAALMKASPSLPSEREKLNFGAPSPSAFVNRLAHYTARDFPPVDDVSLTVFSVPESMEKHLSPAFYLVPPFDDRKNNVVYLNNGSLKNDLSFFTTLAHESYPGHLYQTVYESARNPHPIRRLLYFGGYTEGWATYAEQLSYFYAPVSHELASLLSAVRGMTLNLYSHLDLYIHAYAWTEEQCSAYLKTFGITGRESAHEIFLLVKQQPANYLKYYLGYLKICSLKEKAQNALGAEFNLKEFHEFILSCGPMPLELLEKLTEEWLHSSAFYANAADFS